MAIKVTLVWIAERMDIEDSNFADALRETDANLNEFWTESNIFIKL